MAVIPSIEQQKKEMTSYLKKWATRGFERAVTKLQTEYSTIFLKVSPRLIQDVLSLQRLNPNQIPMFTGSICEKGWRRWNRLRHNQRTHLEYNRKNACHIMTMEPIT
jgi:hypothetical protein